MSATPESSSIDDVEKKAPGPTGTMEKDVGDGAISAPDSEYERYLELHHQFDGPARAKLIRKCKENEVYSVAYIV